MFEKQVKVKFLGETEKGEFRVEIYCPHCYSLMFSIHEPEIPVKFTAKIVCGQWIEETKIFNGKKRTQRYICGKTSRLNFRMT